MPTVWCLKIKKAGTSPCGPWRTDSPRPNRSGPFRLGISDRIWKSQSWWTRKKSKYVFFCHSREGGNPVISKSSGLPPSREWRFLGLFTKPSTFNFDTFVKSPKFVMPDLIRHPGSTEITGFRLSPEWRLKEFQTFYEFVKLDTWNLGKVSCQL